MASKKDFYSALGVSRGASAQEIRSAHRRLARELHPDVNKKADAAQRFSEVQEAYDVLSDAEKRAVYDRVGHAAYTSGVTGAGGGAPGHGAPRPGGRSRGGTYTWSNIGRPPGGAPGPAPGGRGAGESPFTHEDIGSIFDEFFGGRGRPRGAWQEEEEEAAPSPRGGHRAARKHETEHTITVPFMIALAGGVQTLRLEHDGDTETIDVTIPKGITDGAKLRLRGKGGSAHNGESRDLILTIRVEPHARYRRDGLDLAAELPITIVEAALGTQADVETPRGKVDVRVPPGTPSGAKLRLKGRGVEAADGRAGDFFAVVKIVPPAKGTLSAADEKALRELGERLPKARE